MQEREIIERFFNLSQTADDAILTSIGDDAAVISVSSDQQLVVSVDTLIENIHFPKGTSAFDIGYKAVAVNLSDLAAMGALPKWMTLALSLPTFDEQWLQQFSDGMFTLLNKHQVSLIGGDISRGPLSMTLQAHGLVAEGAAILRSTAKPDDIIYVSGELGSATLALHVLQQKVELDKSDLANILPALNRPVPQVALGLALRGIATAMLDLSDGLINDVPKILAASHCGADIDLQKLPVNNILSDMMGGQASSQYAFIGGDDYQLCFTVPPEKRCIIEALRKKLKVRLTEIGKINNKDELILLNSALSYAELKTNSFQHFS